MAKRASAHVEQAIVAEYLLGRPLRELARARGTSVKHVYDILDRNDVLLVKRDRPSSDRGWREAQLLYALRNGNSLEVAAQFARFELEEAREIVARSISAGS